MFTLPQDPSFRRASGVSTQIDLRSASPTASRSGTPTFKNKSSHRSSGNRSSSLSCIPRLSHPINDAKLNAAAAEIVRAARDTHGFQNVKKIPEITVPTKKGNISLSRVGSSPHSSFAADETTSLDRKERVAAFEVQRRQSLHKQDRELQKLLKTHVASIRPCHPDEHASAAKRRADYETKRREDMKRRRERAQQAREFVSHRIEELRIPTDIAKRVSDMVMLKAGSDGMGGIGMDVTMDMVDESYDKAKAEFYDPKIRDLLANKGMSGELRNELIDTISRSSQPWSWLSALRSQPVDDVLRQSASFNELVANISSSSAFACPICLDPMLSVSDDCCNVECNFWSAVPRRNEHWSNYACGHTFCRSCVETWAETAINEQKLNIRCPAAGCKYRLWDQDLQEVLRPRMFDRHQEHKHADHLKNLKSIAKEDESLMGWLRKNARPCPHCHVIVSRSEGCNTMICVCGTRFCYACGFEKCLCRASGKADIWEPGV